MLDPERSQNDLSVSGGTERSTKGGKDFSETNSALDSGFLSGPQANYSSEFDSSLGESSSSQLSVKTKPQPPSKSAVQTDTNIDSGVIDDHDLSHMIIGSGNNVGLPEWFNNLSLNESPSINNLDEKKEKSTSTTEQKAIQQKTKEIQANLWKLCYQQDEDGDTQLHIAIVNELDNPHIISAIIRLAPAPWLLDIKNDYAQAPIHLAALTGQSDIVRRLLVAGAKATIRNGDGNTPLHLACMNGDLLSVKALLVPITAAEIQDAANSANQSVHSYPYRQFSVDLEQRNFYGENCVHIAAQKNNIEILRHLIWAGADINAREGRGGYTPLHIAVENKNEELVKFLLENGKNLDVETLAYRPVTAYQLASELKYKSIEGLLEDHGCERLSPPDSDYEDEDSDDSAEFDSDN